MKTSVVFQARRCGKTICAFHEYLLAKERFMGWADCGNDDLGRPIGYGFNGICDYGLGDATKKRCLTNINRGLAHVCGAMHGGSSYSCGRYFCDKHLTHIEIPDLLQIHRRVRTRYIYVCEACAEEYEKHEH